ncbi:hypothetical protein NNC19_05690 [Clostridium sp. SHJSY1]|uniref:hypothetical protein n=1 Tax=Clostridium sp. SHJSY1 TaxID=2942483 RepID=UPI0028752F5D|nr:hypothetical protein [Clostridium sp. SHJSY1]MDS0525167.1 hypothetical protein [Clostridium sp. SHJSY1]
MKNEIKKELQEFHKRIEEVKVLGIVLNSYTTSIDVEDNDILFDLYEFFCEHLEEIQNQCISVYIQIYSWQFQSYHEGVSTYYTNFYGNSDYDTIQKTDDYLKKSTYSELSKWYSLGVHDYSNYINKKYPNGWVNETKIIDEWIQYNEKIIFEFMLHLCLNIFSLLREEKLDNKTK